MVTDLHANPDSVRKQVRWSSRVSQLLQSDNPYRVKCARQYLEEQKKRSLDFKGIK